MKAAAFFHVIFITPVICTKVLLIGEKNETQLMDLFEESKSNEFQIVKVFIDHDLEDVALNDSFCGFVGAQVNFFVKSSLSLEKYFVKLQCGN